MTSVSTERPNVNATMFSAIQKKLEKQGNLSARQIVAENIRQVDAEGLVLDTKLEVFKQLRAVSVAAGISKAGGAAASAVAM